MASRDPDIASAAASIAVNTHLARLTGSQRKQRTEKGRAAQWQALLDEAAAELGPGASADDIEAAAKNLLRARMSRLALASAQAKAERRRLAGTAA